LIYAKKGGKKFSVINTETRPLFQGRKTARELSRNKVKVTTFVDSAMNEAIEKSDIVLLGADAILRKSIINKIGSEAIAILAKANKKPVYIIADSWKFSPKNVPIEERDFHEVWDKAPEHIKVRNPAFEKIDKRYIKGIVSEYGILKFGNFVRKADRVI
jgi:translation initiation factor 2B subunit (eIF-2B alpha/beta/delta family)